MKRLRVAWIRNARSCGDRAEPHAARAERGEHVAVDRLHDVDRVELRAQLGRQQPADDLAQVRLVRDERPLGRGVVAAVELLEQGVEGVDLHGDVWFRQIE